MLEFIVLMNQNDDDEDLNVSDEEDCVTSKHVRSFKFLPKWIWSRRDVRLLHEVYLSVLCLLYLFILYKVSIIVKSCSSTERKLISNVFRRWNESICWKYWRHVSYISVTLSWNSSVGLIEATEASVCQTYNNQLLH